MTRSLERFPRIVHTLDDLPAPLVDSVRQHQSADAIQSMIYVPPGRYPFRRTLWRFELSFGWRRTPMRVLLIGERSVTVIEVAPETEPEVTTLPLAALLDIHLYLVLLYSWLELTWEDQGSAKSIRVEYNSVGDAMIWDGVTQIRATVARHRFPAAAAQPAIDLSDFPFKFKSYLRSSLMPDEQLVAAVYQPAIRAQGPTLQRFISPNRAVLVTDRNVIVLEDQHQRFRRGDKGHADYVISRHFYPLDRFQRAQVESAPEADLLTLHLGSRAGIYDTTIPLLDSRAQHLCDLLGARGGQAVTSSAQAETGV